MFHVSESNKQISKHLKNIFPFEVQLSSSDSESPNTLGKLWPHGIYSPWYSWGQNTGAGCLSLLQGFFPIQGLNLDLLHCRWILYQLSYKGSPGKFMLYQINKFDGVKKTEIKILHSRQMSQSIHLHITFREPSLYTCLPKASQFPPRQLPCFCISYS